MRPSPLKAELVILENIVELRLESAAAAMKHFGVALRKRRIEAIAGVIEKEATSSRSIGDIRIAERLERRARAIRIFYDHGLDTVRLVPPVDLQEGYRGKILLVSVSGGAAGGITCLRSGDLWHEEILMSAAEEIRDLGFEHAAVDSAGGASVRFDADGTIRIYGTSDSFGECDKTIASDLIGRSFPERRIVVE
ncbi:MAG: hypothetical protein C4530_15625 [Desulfobacteraceae bacterium]|nr:MAG: hypothetical protein C4530_15625 [Desulfobacteraceae bacterium]